jgi:hypothetical protein
VQAETTRQGARVVTARILDISPDEYHTRPGLSASIATTLIGRSPRHAWHEHPCFGGKGKAPTSAMDLGQVVHALVLGRGKAFAPVPFDDFKTKAARETRDNFRAAGLVPILTHQFVRARSIAAAALWQLRERGIRFTGQSELAIEWEEKSKHGPVLCRGMFDHVWIDRGVILDLKCVGNAELSQVERSAERFGYAIQATAYRRALSALRPEHTGRVEFLFAFVESEEPYALNLTTPDGMMREIGSSRWKRAVELWGQCIATHGAERPWPGYGTGINMLSAPAWALMKEGV